MLSVTVIKHITFFDLFGYVLRYLFYYFYKLVIVLETELDIYLVFYQVWWDRNLGFIKIILLYLFQGYFYKQFHKIYSLA